MGIWLPGHMADISNAIMLNLQNIPQPLEEQQFITPVEV